MEQLPQQRSKRKILNSARRRQPNYNGTTSSTKVKAPHVGKKEMKFNLFLHCLKQGRDTYTQPRRQHPATRVDCKGPFIAACSYNSSSYLSLSETNAFLEIWTLQEMYTHWWTCQKWWNISRSMGRLNFHHTATSRWCYRKIDVFFGPKFHILCCTFKNLIAMRLLNCAESRGIGPAHFRLTFFCVQMTWNSDSYLPMSPEALCKILCNSASRGRFYHKITTKKTKQKNPTSLACFTEM